VSSTELPPVPRLPTRSASGKKREPRQRALTRDAIAAAGLRVVDAEGLDAMTMRRVADELGTGAASLYAHVANKEELLELVVDRVIAEAQVPDTFDPENWEEELKQAMRAIRAVFSSHRDIARASFARIPLGENALRGSEWMISVLRAGGLSDKVIAFACDLLPMYVTAIAYEDSLYDSEGITPEQMAQFVDDMRSYMESLPRDRFPNVVAMAAAMTSGDGDERFEFGLDVLVRGLASMRED
jgi:AcrR family transcriptional regulator